jgi:hypothetical protein
MLSKLIDNFTRYQSRMVAAYVIKLLDESRSSGGPMKNNLEVYLISSSSFEVLSL